MYMQVEIPLDRASLHCFNVNKDVTTIHKYSAVWSQPPDWQMKWKQSHMLSTGLAQDVTESSYMLSSSQTEQACYSKEWQACSGLLQKQCASVTLQGSCGCTVLDIPESRDKVTES